MRPQCGSNALWMWIWIWIWKRTVLVLSVRVRARSDSKMSNRWKDFERRCARKMGGRRRPVTGIDRGDGDAYTGMFELQCKLRLGIPKYLREWLDDIVATARHRNKVGVVV